MNDRIRLLVRGSKGSSLASNLILLNLFVLFCKPQALVPIDKIFLTVILFLSVFAIWTPRFKQTLNPTVKGMLLFVGVHGVLIFLGRAVFDDLILNDGIAFARWKNLVQYFFCFLFPIIPFFVSGKALRKLLTVLLISSLYLSIWVLTHGGRGPSGFVADENDVCLVLICLLAFSLTGASIYKSLFWRMFSIGVSLITLLAIVGTSSRGGFLGLAAMFLVYIPLHPHRFRILIASIVMFFALLPFIPEKYVDEVTSIFTTSTQEGDTGRARLDTWAVVTKMWLEPKNFVQGTGLDNHAWNMHLYEEAERGLSRRSLAGRQAHSTLFQLLGDTGFFGLCLLGFLCFRSLNSLRKLRKLSSRVIRSRQGALSSEEKLLLGEWKFMQKYTVALASSFIGAGAAALFISTLYYPTIWFLLCVNETTIRYGERLLSAQKSLADA